MRGQCAPAPSNPSRQRASLASEGQKAPAVTPSVPLIGTNLVTREPLARRFSGPLLKGVPPVRELPTPSLREFQASSIKDVPQEDGLKRPLTEERRQTRDADVGPLTTVAGHPIKPATVPGLGIPLPA